MRKTISSWALAATVLVAFTFVAGAAELSLKITGPAAGKATPRPYFSGVFTGLAQEVVVKIDFAGNTHYLFAVPNSNPRGVFIGDGYLPIVVGPQELAVTVLAKDGKEILPTQKVAFIVEKPQSRVLGDEHGYNDIRASLNGNAGSVEQYWQTFCTAVVRAEENNKPEYWQTVEKAAQNYLGARSDEFHSRIKAYADLAEKYIYAGLPGDAMRAAMEAERIYEAEKGVVTHGQYFNNFPLIYDPRPAYNVGCPAHYAVLAELYGMMGDTDTAITWIQKSIDFLVAESKAPHLGADAKKRVLADAAAQCRMAGFYSILINKDFDKYDQWQKKAAQFSTSGPGSGARDVNLIGQ
jgi:hypothetical protein